MRKNFSANGKGFQIVVNGYVLSIQFGVGNYCENRCSGYIGLDNNLEAFSSNDAEIGLWSIEEDAKGFNHDWVRLTSYDDVKGYVSSSEVCNLISFLTIQKRTPEDIRNFMRSADRIECDNYSNHDDDQDDSYSYPA